MRVTGTVLEIEGLCLLAKGFLELLTNWISSKCPTGMYSADPKNLALQNTVWSLNIWACVKMSKAVQLSTCSNKLGRPSLAHEEVASTDFHGSHISFSEQLDIFPLMLGLHFH